MALGWGLGTSAGQRGGLSDVWRVRWKATGGPPLWTWISGPSTINHVSGNGTISGRYGGTHWVRDDCLYVYGGHGIGSDGKQAFLASTFSFCGLDSNNNGWKHLHGRDAQSDPVYYSPQGTFDVRNSPGSRYGGVALPVLQNSSLLYLFGGSGGPYADVWAFDTNINMWAWMAGPQGGGFLGNATWPSGRRDCTIFPISDKEMILSSGYGVGSYNATAQGGLSDIWRLTIS